MKANIVKIGNSQGIRIPKTVIEQCGFDVFVELKVIDNKLIISPPLKPRDGWNEAFAIMHENKDDTLLENDTIQNDFDDKEWTW